MTAPGVLPAWIVTTESGAEVTVRLTLEGAITVDLPSDDEGEPKWWLVEEMSPDEAGALGEALLKARDAAREMGR